MILIWIKFFICIFFVVSAGYYLSVTADKIADIKGLSKAWVGIVLLASITSLPELATTIAARRSPDLAIGNIFGSNAINIVIIAVIDFLSKGTPILGIVSIGHILNAGFGLFITGISLFALLLRSHFNDSLSLRSVGIESIIIFVVYFIGMKFLYSYEQDTSNTKDAAPSPGKTGSPNPCVSLKKEYCIIIISSVFVVISGIWLAQLGDEIAAATGWGTTFVGSVFLAFATSLPEIVVSLSAISLKSFDMCVGNMFGSNFFNIFIISILDMVTTDHTILSQVSVNHVLTAVLGITLTSLIIMGIVFRTRKKYIVINYEIWMVVICYLLGSYFLFTIATK